MGSAAIAMRIDRQYATVDKGVCVVFGWTNGTDLSHDNYIEEIYVDIDIVASFDSPLKRALRVSNTTPGVPLILTECYLGGNSQHYWRVAAKWNYGVNLGSVWEHSQAQGFITVPDTRIFADNLVIISKSLPWENISITLGWTPGAVRQTWLDWVDLTVHPNGFSDGIFSNRRVDNVDNETVDGLISLHRYLFRVTSEDLQGNWHESNYVDYLSSGEIYLHSLISVSTYPGKVWYFGDDYKYHLVPDLETLDCLGGSSAVRTIESYFDSNTPISLPSSGIGDPLPHLYGCIVAGEKWADNLTLSIRNDNGQPTVIFNWTPADAGLAQYINVSTNRAFPGDDYEYRYLAAPTNQYTWININGPRGPTNMYAMMSTLLRNGEWKVSNIVEFSLAQFALSGNFAAPTNLHADAIDAIHGSVSLRWNPATYNGVVVSQFIDTVDLTVHPGGFGEVQANWTSWPIVANDPYPDDWFVSAGLAVGHHYLFRITAQANNGSWYESNYVDVTLGITPPVVGGPSTLVLPSGLLITGHGVGLVELRWYIATNNGFPIQQYIDFIDLDVFPLGFGTPPRPDGNPQYGNQFNTTGTAVIRDLVVNHTYLFRITALDPVSGFWLESNYVSHLIPSPEPTKGIDAVARAAVRAFRTRLQGRRRAGQWIYDTGTEAGDVRKRLIDLVAISDRETGGTYDPTNAAVRYSPTSDSGVWQINLPTFFRVISGYMASDGLIVAGRVLNWQVLSDRQLMIDWLANIDNNAKVAVYASTDGTSLTAWTTARGLTTNSLHAAAVDRALASVVEFNDGVKQNGSELLVAWKFKYSGGALPAGRIEVQGYAIKIPEGNPWRSSAITLFEMQSADNPYSVSGTLVLPPVESDMPRGAYRGEVVVVDKETNRELARSGYDGAWYVYATGQQA